MKPIVTTGTGGYEKLEFRLCISAHRAVKTEVFVHCYRSVVCRSGRKRGHSGMMPGMTFPFAASPLTRAGLGLKRPCCSLGCGGSHRFVCEG
jgi:hypothetical protein